VTDIFFSYSSADRERVRPVRDALVAQGFEVFWDQEVPTGLDWDSWIRQHLAKCKCAMAFWSAASVASDNVRHEAVVAKQQGKLISVLLETLTAQQFPMGLYAQQAANLADWNGDPNHKEWRKLRREYEAKLIPTWVRQQLDELEAELVGERARREGVERRDKTLQAQIAKEAQAHQDLKRELDKAVEDTAALQATIENISKARSEAEARGAEVAREIATLSATVDEVTRARTDAEQRLTKLRQTKAKEIVRSISPIVIAAALATLGIWAYQLVSPAPQPLPAIISESTMAAEREQGAIREDQLRQAAADTQAKLEAAEDEQQRLKDELQRQIKAAGDFDSKRRAVEAEQQSLKDEVQRQTKAAADADLKRKAAEADQQTLKDQVRRLTTTAADADTKRRDAEADQQRLKVEVQRQTKAAADADTARKAAEAEQQRLTEDLRKARAEVPKQGALPQATSVVLAPSFERRTNMEAFDKMPAGSERVSTAQACQERCARSGTCQAFTFSNASNLCLLYDLLPSFRSNTSFDSGVRQSSQTSVQSGTPQPPAQQAAALPAGQPDSRTGGFDIRSNTMVIGSFFQKRLVRSIEECEKVCKENAACKVFSHSRTGGDWRTTTTECFLYSDVTVRMSPNVGYDTGIRP
jgi:hypothetical protein